MSIFIIYNITMGIFLNNCNKIFKSLYNPKKIIIDISILISFLLLTLILMIIIFFSVNEENIDRSLRFLSFLPLFTTIQTTIFLLIFLPYKFHILKYDSFKLNIYRRKDFFIIYFFLTFVWCIFSFFLLNIFVLCFLSNNIDLLKTILYGQWFFSILINCFAISSFSLFILFLVKNRKIFLAFLICYFLISFVLADQLTGFSLISKTQIISYISLISPINYSLSLVSNACYVPDFLLSLKAYANQLGFTINEFMQSDLFVKFFNTKIVYIYGLNIFDFSSAFYSKTDLFTIDLIINRWEKILNIVAPFLLIFSFSFANYNLFYNKNDLSI